MGQGQCVAIIALFCSTQLGPCCHQAPISFDHVVECLDLRGLDLLGYASNLNVWLKMDIPGIYCKVSLQQTKQTGFTNTIGTR